MKIERPEDYIIHLDKREAKVLSDFLHYGMNWINHQKTTLEIDEDKYNKLRSDYLEICVDVINLEFGRKIQKFALTSWEVEEVLGLMDMGTKYADHRLEIGTMDKEKRDKWVRRNKRLRKKILENAG